MKIAASDFLNAKPLTYGLANKDMVMTFASPNACAQALAKGEVDIAMIPSIEYARIKNLSIVPDAVISSKGAVKSVLLFLKGNLSEAQTIAVDPRSKTGFALLKVLEQNYFQRSFKYEVTTQGFDKLLELYDGVLLIGDQALKQSLNFKGQVIDLGQAWQELTNLPFTYAFWAGRSDDIDETSLIRLIKSKKRGQANIQKIARESVLEINEDFVLSYLTQNICYDWTSEHEAGLRLFYEMAFREHLIPKLPDLRWYELEKYSFKNY